MIDGFWIAITLLGLVVSAVGWSVYGASLASAGTTRVIALPKTLLLLGNPKLVWAWVLLLAVSGSSLVSTQLGGSANLSVVAWAAAYAFLWCVAAAIITRLRKQGNADPGSEATYRSWPSLVLSLCGIGVGILIGMLLLALWLEIGA